MKYFYAITTIQFRTKLNEYRSTDKLKIKSNIAEFNFGKLVSRSSILIIKIKNA